MWKSIVLVVRLGAVLAAVSTLGACATVISGSSQAVAVNSNPNGAECRLDRAGQLVGSVQTPGTLQVERSKNDITVTCKKEGYQDTQAPLASSFNNMTFGNFLLGGLVGVAVDAASGANNKYPDTVTVVMLPAAFATPQARDDYFGRVKDQVNVNAAQAITKLRTECPAERREQCSIEIKNVEQERDRQLMEVEQRRVNARMAG